MGLRYCMRSMIHSNKIKPGAQKEVKPTTSRTRCVRSTAVLQPLPLLVLEVVFVGGKNLQSRSKDVEASWKPLG